MNKKQPISILATPLTRRAALRAAGVGLAAVPLGQLLACSSSEPSGPEPGSDAPDAAAPDSGAGSEWASGGTAAMVAKDSYPNPFSGGVDTACALTCAMILGPCYDEVTFERADISEGYPGLPVRLALRVVDESCTPVEGAIVDVWHTSTEGIYSGDITSFCNNGRDVADEHFFRGYQTTDASGRVDFDTCFPGWYPGRAIHIHFTIRRGGITGDEYVTSQLFFTDGLTEEIFASHPDYAAYGQPDTTNRTDGIVSGDEASEYILTSARMTDGAMQASKTIVIRSSLSSALCTAGSAGGPPGP